MRKVVRRALILFVLATAATATWFAFYAGVFLYREDPLRRADAIFVLGGARLERGLEAADLYREGYAPIIAVSPEQEEPAEVVARARGIHFPRSAEVLVDALANSGIPRNAFVIGPGSVDNTAEEARMLRAFTTARGWRTVIVVTSRLHTRRAGFAMRRALSGTGVDVVIRASRYDPASPSRWWRSRADTRFVVTEWQKMIAYTLGVAE